MFELHPDPTRLPLQLASRVLSAPSVWVPGSRLPLAGLGALVTPPLGWAWDGEAAPWEAWPGALLWQPPRRPLARFVQRLAREQRKMPRLFTVAPDAPRGVAEALRALEAAAQPTAGFLLWDATPDAVAAAKRDAPALPVLAERPAPEVAALAPALLEAGADGLWLGPPRAGEARLWGPAVLPLLLAALADAPRDVPCIAGAGIAHPDDARRLRDAGADAVALGPPWWVQPGLAAAVLAALAHEKAVP